MPYTRTQASALLTQTEMKLFDDSRANAVRKLDPKALASRVERTRKLRDKARDQLQRQRLASRSRTGSKRGTSGEANRRSKDKAELLADILKRFEAQARAAGKQAGAGAAARKPATKAGAKKTAAKQAAGKKTAAKKTPPAAGPARRAASKGKAPISPDQALANTRALLEAKKRHDREGPAWQHLDGAASPPAGRYQSPEARSKAEELHAGESRMTAIEGSISTRGRKNQAKRDKR
jgi:hypothetical protein